MSSGARCMDKSQNIIVMSARRCFIRWRSWSPHHLMWRWFDGIWTLFLNHTIALALTHQRRILTVASLNATDAQCFSLIWTQQESMATMENRWQNNSAHCKLSDNVAVRCTLESPNPSLFHSIPWHRPLCNNAQIHRCLSACQPAPLVYSTF